MANRFFFCRYYEDFPLEYPQASTTHILGVCTGLLAASAIASSRSLSSLIPLAVQTLRIAFRLGSRVATVGHQVETQTSIPQTWSTIVLGVNSEDAGIALSEFNENHVSCTDDSKDPILILTGPLTFEPTLHQRRKFHVGHHQWIAIYAEAAIRHITAVPESSMSRNSHSGTIPRTPLIQPIRCRQDYRR